MCLRVYIVERLCWVAKGRQGMAEEVDEQSKSRPTPIFLFPSVPSLLAQLLIGRQFVSRPVHFVTGVNRGSYTWLSCPLNTEDSHLFLLGLWHARISWILPSSNTKKPHTVVGRCMCIHTRAQKAEWGPEHLCNCNREFKWTLKWIVWEIGLSVFFPRVRWENGYHSHCTVDICVLSTKSGKRETASWLFFLDFRKKKTNKLYLN